MAMIDCPECKAQISNTAPSCPKCGYTGGKPKPVVVEQKTSFVTWIAAFIMVSCTVSMLTPDKERDERIANAAAERQRKMQPCIDKGIAYFKEIGSYPKLASTGERAEQVAKDRCERTTTAFGP